VDAESCYADVVWREYRPHTNPNTHSNANANANYKSIHSATGGNASTASTLRRERFSFDDIYAGPSAFDKLTSYSKLRTRQALLYHKPSLVFLTTVCGEDANIYNRRHMNTILDSNLIEPPVALVLGDGGGLGLAAVVISEIFVTLPHLHTKETHVLNRFEKKTISNTNKYKYRNNSNNIPNINNTHTNGSKHNDPYVTMRACVILDNNTIVDLLCSNHNIHTQVNQCYVDTVDSNANGNNTNNPRKSVIVNATEIQLKKPSDFDRIIGVIFGRKMAMNGFLAGLAGVSDYSTENTRKMYQPDGTEVMLHHLSQTPWLIPNDNATLLITVTVHNKTIKSRNSNSSGSGVGVGGGNSTTDFHFACPCGQQWSTPCKCSVYMCMIVIVYDCICM